MLTVAAFAGPVSAQEKAPDAAPAGDECSAWKAEVEGKIGGAWARLEEDIRAFGERQRAEREAFEKENHTQEEIQEFEARQQAAYDELKAKLHAEVESRAAELWRDYESKCASREGDGGTGSNEGDIPKECEGDLERLKEIMSDLVARWESRQKSFQEDFDAARAAFSKGEHTPEEWKAFGEEWYRRAKALFEEILADAQAAMREGGLGDCFAALQARGIVSFDGAASMVAPPEPPSGRPEYARPAPPEGLDPEMETIWRECEARVQALMEEHWSHHKDDRLHATTGGSSSSDGPTAPPPEPAGADNWDGGHEMPPELMEKLQAVRAECEAKARELYNSKRGGEGHEGGFGSFQFYWDEAAQRIIVKGKYVSMVGVPEAQMMTEIKVAGRLYIDQLYANGYLATFEPQQTDAGTAIQVFDSTGAHILSVHDNPRGVINVATSGEIPSVTIDLADALKVARTDKGVEFSDGTYTGAILVHAGSLTLGEGNAATLDGRATFLVTDSAATGDDGLGDSYHKALLAKQVGAEVIVAADDESVKSDATPIGDLEVDVKKDESKKGQKVVARVESKEGTGKTVVLKIDKTVLDAKKLKVKVEAVNSDGSLGGITVREASSLEDVLNPHDDGDVVEYWIVQDQNGWQVLVSFPHFSEKQVTVESADAEEVGSLLPGFGGAFALVALGALAVVAGTRRRA